MTCKLKEKQKKKKLSIAITCKLKERGKKSMRK
jgi:hypothetical protein